MRQLITVDTSATIAATFYPAGTGSGADAGANDGTVTVAVTRADGTTVAGVGAVSVGAAGLYTATLPAQTALDVLTATWTGATSKVRTTHEIVGRQLVELAEIRGQTNLNNPTAYPNVVLDDARAWFVDLVVDYCGFSPIPRYAYETVSGTGRSVVQLTNRPYIRTLRSVSIDGTAESDLTRWALDEGILDRRLAGGTFNVGIRNVAVGYEHGLDSPQADLRRAALTAIRFRVLTDTNNQIPDRALSMTNEYGNIQMAQPGESYPVGIPEVDAILTRRRLVSVA